MKTRANDHTDALRSRILKKLRGIAHQRRIIPERMLAASLDKLDLLVDELEKKPLPSEAIGSWKLVLDCCVETRIFTDWLHTRFLLKGSADIAKWQESLSAVEIRIGAVADQLIGHLRDSGNNDLAEQLERYRSSIGFRKNLACKMSDGLEATRDLIFLDLGKLAPREASTPEGESGGAPPIVGDIDAETAVSLFFVWKSVRFLRHKLLFAAAELSHEAGPWLQSINDHLSINSNAHELSGVLVEDSVVASTNDRVSRWKSATIDILGRVANTITCELGAIKQRQEALGDPHAMLGGDENLRPKIESLRDLAISYYTELQRLESEISPSVEIYIDSLDLNSLWTDCSVAEDGLEELVNDLRSGKFDEASDRPDDELADWLDAILLHGWSLKPPLERPETLALLIFRNYVRRNSYLAATYLCRCLNLTTAAKVLQEHVTLMFCGVLIKETGNPDSELPPWYKWIALAKSVADKDSAAGYSTAGRVAVSAALMSICICVAEDNQNTANAIRTSLDSIDYRLRRGLDNNEIRRVDYFFAHLFVNLEGVQRSDNSALQRMLKSITDSESKNQDKELPISATMVPVGAC